MTPGPQVKLKTSSRFIFFAISTFFANSNLKRETRQRNAVTLNQAGMMCSSLKEARLYSQISMKLLQITSGFKRIVTLIKRLKCSSR